MAALVFVLREESDAKALYAALKEGWHEAAEQGKPVTVTVHEFEEPRTEAQNRKFWQLMRQIAKNAWLHGGQFGPESWAEYYRRQFIGITTTPRGKEVGISSHTLNITKFSELLTMIEHHAQHELGLEPNLL